MTPGDREGHVTHFKFKRILTYSRNFKPWGSKSFEVVASLPLPHKAIYESDRSKILKFAENKLIKILVTPDI